jgi:hypothetical protein
MRCVFARVFRLIVPFWILAAGANLAVAQDMQTAQAIKMITDTANQLCQTAPLDQTNTGLKLSGDAQAKVGGVIGKLADLGFSGAADYQAGRSVGVLQQDLVKAIENSNNCKLDVLHTLSSALLNGAQHPPADRVPASQDANPFGTRSAFIHFNKTSSSGSAKANNLNSTLLPLFGFTEIRAVDEVPLRPTIRYFFRDDAAAAQTLANMLNRNGGNWTIQDFTSFQPRPRPGLIELWVPDR